MATSPILRKAPRITLLGLPDAGKSSLMDALVESPETRQQLVPNHLIEIDTDLANLRKQLSDTDVLKADALLLVTDTADSTGQFDEILAEFARFLSLLEQIRGNRAAVGGWPVFLVLTKCDLLARAGDSQAAWKQRIEQVKRQVERHFQQFLDARQTAGPVPYGRIDLHLRATAIKRPALTDASPEPHESFGIEELFQQVFVAVRAYRQRRARSSWRLAWTTLATLILVAGVLGLAGFLFSQRRLEDPAIRELLDKVESYRAREPLTTSNRLREPLQPHISELADLEHDPQFARLPSNQKEYVRQRRQELEDYRAYQDSVQQLPAVAALSTEQELEALETRLKELAVPASAQTDWSQTEAALLRSRRLKEVGALRAGIAEMEQWYGKLQERGQALATLSGGASDRRSQLGLLLQEAARPPHQDRDLLPGSRLTYESVYRFADVARARAAWEDLRRRLERLNDVTTALGLGLPDPAGSPLAIPAGFTAEQAAPLLAELERLYPHYQDEFRLNNLPEAALADVRKAARQRYDLALAAGRAVVLRRLKEASPDGQETPDSWRRVLPWLADPAELKAWRILALVLARLVDAAAVDPVTALEAFLRRDQFDLTLKRFYLEVPEGRNIEPSGRLVVEHPSGGTAAPQSSFEPLAEADPDARHHLIRYTFRPPAEVRFTYKPGEALSAELPISFAGSADYALTWSQNRTSSYQFERLLRSPRLHRKDQAGSQGQVAEGVRLVISPDDGVPRVPDLLPDLSRGSP